MRGWHFTLEKNCGHPPVRSGRRGRLWMGGASAAIGAVERGKVCLPLMTLAFATDAFFFTASMDDLRLIG